MKHELSAVCDACHRICIENCIETHSKGRQSGRRRQIPPGLLRMLLGVNNCMEPRRHPVGSEGMAMTCFGQVSMVSSEIGLGKCRVLSGQSSSLGHCFKPILRHALVVRD